MKTKWVVLYALLPAVILGGMVWVGLDDKATGWLLGCVVFALTVDRLLNRESK